MPTAPTVRAAPTAPRGLLTMLGLLALMVPAYVLVPVPDAARMAWYDLIGSSAIVIGFLGLRHHRPGRRRGWLLVLIGCAGWVFGDLVWTIEQYLLPDHYPAPSDGVYLCSYFALGAGSLIFVRTRRDGRDVAALLDATIVTVSAAVVVGVFMVAPLALASGLSLPTKVVSAAYPLADLFLLGVLARMYTMPGARSLSFHLLTAALGLMLTADVVFELEVLVSGNPAASSLWTDGGWLLGYILLASAACVPSMTNLVEPDRDQTELPPTTRRLVVLTSGLMLPGVVLLLDGATGGGIRWPVIGIGTLVLSGLVLVRMAGLLNVVQVQAIRLTALAQSDSLTGAPNRRTWDQELSRACMLSRQRGTSLCVAILDLDRFKVYNDTHGHQAGDQLLREAVTGWTEALPADALLARYGGEEFALLVRGRGIGDVTRMLRELRAVTPGEQTFSAGVALWEPQTDPTTAVAGADEALYAAKRAGRDRIFVFGQDISGDAATAAPRAKTAPSFPPFTMLIQPIVDLRTFTISSHEALARFAASEGDDVQQVFRRAHLAGYGDLLELAAIRAALALPDRPADHDLFVNVSARAVVSERFLAGLPNCLHGVVVELCEDPEDIEFSAVADAVARLRQRGARIALDDVGAGAQEFARLAMLQPDIIKADRSLVSGCAGNAGRTAVLRALVTYAQALDLNVCAEGVEEVADLAHLSSLGITHAQGHLLALPSRTWQQQVIRCKDRSAAGSASVPS